MSRFAIKIGNQEFTSKTQALSFYKTILNAYKVGEELNTQDFESLKSLLYCDKRMQGKIPCTKCKSLERLLQRNN